MVDSLKSPAQFLARTAPPLSSDCHGDDAAFDSPASRAHKWPLHDFDEERIYQGGMPQEPTPAIIREQSASFGTRWLCWMC